MLCISASFWMLENHKVVQSTYFSLFKPFFFFCILFLLLRQKEEQMIKNSVFCHRELTPKMVDTQELLTP